MLVCSFCACLDFSQCKNILHRLIGGPKLSFRWECFVVFFSVLRCNRLANRPGYTPPLRYWQPYNQKWENSRFRKWMDVYLWIFLILLFDYNLIFSLLSNKLGLIVCDYMKIYCCKLQLLQCLLTPTVKGRTNLKIKEKYLSPAGSTTKGLTVSRSNSSLSLYSSASAPTSPKTCKASLWHATHFVE